MNVSDPSQQNMLMGNYFGGLTAPPPTNFQDWQNGLQSQFSGMGSNPDPAHVMGMLGSMFLGPYGLPGLFSMGQYGGSGAPGMGMHPGDGMTHPGHGMHGQFPGVPPTMPQYPAQNNWWSGGGNNFPAVDHLRQNMLMGVPSGNPNGLGG